MNRRELDHMIQDHLDGSATPAESERLRRMLDQPGIQASYRQLEVVFGALRQLEMSEPPADLAAIVRTAQKTPVGDRAPATGRPWSRFRLALSFAAGVVSCMLVFVAAGKLGVNGPAGDLPLGGTLPRSLTMATSLASRRLALTTGDIVLASRRTGDQVTILVEVRAVAEPLVTIAFDDQAMTLMALRRDPGPSGAADAASVAPGRIELRPASAGHYAFEFHAEPSTPPVEVTIHDGSRTWRESLTTVSAGRRR